MYVEVMISLARTISLVGNTLKKIGMSKVMIIRKMKMDSLPDCMITTSFILQNLSTDGCCDDNDIDLFLPPSHP